MKLVGIEWDDDKNEKNKREHDLSFETAQYVFADPERLNARIKAKKIHRVKKDGKPWVWLGRLSLWSIRNAGRTGVLYPRG